MPAYIKFDDVKLRLANKVRFTDDPDAEVDKMPSDLAIRLIDEAEGQVEMDLSPRYSVPFVHPTTGLYKDIPDRPTKNILRTLCELKACIRILEDDFGSGGAIDGAKYIERLEKRYRSIIDEDLMAKPASEYDATRQWKNPPLQGLKKNWFNECGDDGYAGVVLVASSGDGGFPAGQINDPGESFLNVSFEDEN